MVSRPVIFDDLSGEIINTGETVQFGLDGSEYEIDLTVDNTFALRSIFIDYLKHARRVGGRVTRRNITVGEVQSPKPVAGGTMVSANKVGVVHEYGKEQRQAIRQWAIKKGKKISDRGRLPTDVIVEWEQEHQTPVKSNTGNKTKGRGRPNATRSAIAKADTRRAVPAAAFTDAGKSP